MAADFGIIELQADGDIESYAPPAALVSQFRTFHDTARDILVATMEVLPNSTARAPIDILRRTSEKPSAQRSILKAKTPLTSVEIPKNTTVYVEVKDTEKMYIPFFPFSDTKKYLQLENQGKPIEEILQKSVKLPNIKNLTATPRSGAVTIEFDMKSDHPSVSFIDKVRARFSGFFTGPALDEYHIVVLHGFLQEPVNISIREGIRSRVVELPIGFEMIMPLRGGRIKYDNLDPRHWTSVPAGYTEIPPPPPGTGGLPAPAPGAATVPLPIMPPVPTHAIVRTPATGEPTTPATTTTTTTTPTPAAAPAAPAPAPAAPAPAPAAPVTAAENDETLVRLMEDLDLTAAPAPAPAVSAAESEAAATTTTEPTIATMPTTAEAAATTTTEPTIATMPTATTTAEPTIATMPSTAESTATTTTEPTIATMPTTAESTATTTTEPTIATMPTTAESTATTTTEPTIATMPTTTTTAEPTTAEPTIATMPSTAESTATTATEPTIATMPTATTTTEPTIATMPTATTTTPAAVSVFEETGTTRPADLLPPSARTHLEDAVQSQAVIQAPANVPDELRVSTTRIVKVRGDGWCFYRAVLKALETSPTDDDRTADHIPSQQLAGDTARWLQEHKDEFERPFNAAFSTGKDRIPVNGIERAITFDEYIDILPQSNPTHEGLPSVWPEIDMGVGRAVADTKDINIAVYSLLPWGPNKYTLSGYFPGKPTSTKLVSLLNVDGAHFNVLKPRAVVAPPSVPTTEVGRVNPLTFENRILNTMSQFIDEKQISDQPSRDILNNFKPLTEVLDRLKQENENGSYILRLPRETGPAEYTIPNIPTGPHENVSIQFRNPDALVQFVIEPRPAPVRRTVLNTKEPAHPVVVAKDVPFRMEPNPILEPFVRVISNQ